MTFFRSQLESLRSFTSDLMIVVGDGWRRLPKVLALILLAMALDLLGVALVAPFLSLLLSPTAPLPAWMPLRQLWEGDSGLRWLAAALLSVYAIKGTVAYWTQKTIVRVTEGERARLMGRLLESFQAMPYEYHLARNGAEMVNTVVWYTQAYTAGVLAALLRLAADLLVFLALGVLLSLSDPAAVVLLVVVLAVVFVAVGKLVRLRLSRAFQAGARYSQDVMQSVSQALAGFREVRIFGRERYFRERLDVAAAGLVESSSSQSALGMIPRHAVEVAVIAFLVLLVWVTHHGGNAQELVPVLGTFAAAAIRLMPASTAMLSNWNGVRSYRFVLRALVRDLDAIGTRAPTRRPPAETPGPAEEFRELRVENIRFTYAGAGAPALDGISVSIAAGEIAALVGRSGAGKSTLADVILGLLQPQSGRITVNGRDIASNLLWWHRMVAYIPQTVYLIDDTLRRNIAFGVPDVDIDSEKLKRAVGDAQLDDLVSSLPRGLDTEVGERGARLSGGQRQRLAIARAFYHDRSVLVLDEATSALDAETEEAVVRTIKALHGRRTLIVIAHKQSMIADANVVVRLEPKSDRD